MQRQAIAARLVALPQAASPAVMCPTSGSQPVADQAATSRTDQAATSRTDQAATNRTDPTPPAARLVVPG